MHTLFTHTWTTAIIISGYTQRDELHSLIKVPSASPKMLKIRCMRFLDHREWCWWFTVQSTCGLLIALADWAVVRQCWWTGKGMSSWYMTMYMVWLKKARKYRDPSPKLNARLGGQPHDMSLEALGSQGRRRCFYFSHLAPESHFILTVAGLGDLWNCGYSLSACINRVVVKHRLLKGR